MLYLRSHRPIEPNFAGKVAIEVRYENVPETLPTPATVRNEAATFIFMLFGIITNYAAAPI